MKISGAGVFLALFTAATSGAGYASDAEPNTCSGNYVGPGQRGHGEISYLPEAQIGWTVVDYMDENESGCVRVVCRKGVAPRPGLDDVDFFEADGAMHKLISGAVTLGPDGFEVTPKRAKRMKVFSVPSAFPVAQTPWLYGFNHWREDKLSRRESLTPLEYLRHLKATNASCAGLPLPE